MPPATRFGPYEIIRRLGKSMNDVYLAQDTRANRQAALKLIKTGSDAASQLLLEAERRGAAIQQGLRTLDPRVIEIYDFGDLDGYFYVAMQYVEGRNLAEVLKGDGRMGAYRAARVALEICGQLEKFHASVVHGDIKPSNIHLGLNETVRLLDFGIAKMLRPDRDFTFHNFGSPSYCSPERLGRSQVDQQADLWAVGVTLYEMVAGSPPYQAENTRKLEKLIQSGRPPRALPASCPAPLKAVIRKALAPDAARRYKSAAAFADDLRAFLEGARTAAASEGHSGWRPNPTVESGQAKPRPGRRPRKPIAAAIGCVLAGMLLFIGTSYCSRYWRAVRDADLDAESSLHDDLQAQFGFLGSYSPAELLREPLRIAHEKAAKQILARGYTALQQDRRDEARTRFQEAARDLPQSPEPHLALARLDLKASMPTDALTELSTAERLGHVLGEQELQQRTEAYRLRGFEELQSGDVAAARQDFTAAHIDFPAPTPQPPAKPWGRPPGLRGASRPRSRRHH